MTPRPDTAKARALAAQLHRLASYFSASIDVRNSIALQQEDERFARVERGSIRYVIDSNLVRFFLDPASESDRVNPFADDRDAPYRKLAIITAEFIFSREMEGQWGVPAMVSPSHMAELSDHMHKLAQRLARRAEALEEQAGAAERSPDNAIRLAQAAETLGPSVEAFNALETDRQSGARAEWLRELREAEMFERLRRQDLLSPLYLDEHATDDVIEPMERHTRAWLERITRQHRNSVVERKNARRRNPLQDKADAETAEQIVQLNRVAKDSSLSPTRYVLVTLDRNLFNAAVEWWEEKGRQELDFFPFRRLSQYVPFLNTDLMPNTLDDVDVRDQLQQAFDSLLGMSARRRRKMPLYIPESTLSPPAHSLAEEVLSPLEWMSERWRGLAPVQETVVSIWRDLTERANYLNPELLSRRDDSFENFAEFLANSPNTREAAIAYLRQAVDRVDVVNIELSVAHNIASEIMKRRHHGAAQAVRAMPVLREPFSELLEGEALYDLLDEAVIERNPDRLTPIVKRLTQERRWRAAFFAGCVAFWVGHWDGAAVYARRAADAAETRERRAELAYMKVLTARFAALNLPQNGDRDDRQNLRRIALELKRLEGDVDAMVAAGAESDAFARCRAGIEQALWKISIAYAEGFIGEGAGSKAKDDAVEALNVFQKLEAEMDRLSATDVPDQALKTMEIERLIGEAGCLIFLEKLAADGGCRQRAEMLADRLEAWVAENPRIAPSFYAVAVPLLRPGKAEQAVAAISRILEENHHMTWFDRVALQGMRDVSMAPAIPQRRI